MNIGGGQIGVPFLTLLQQKSAPFCIFQTLPSVSKITPEHYILKAEQNFLDGIYTEV